MSPPERGQERRCRCCEFRVSQNNRPQGFRCTTRYKPDRQRPVSQPQQDRFRVPLTVTGKRCIRKRPIGRVAPRTMGRSAGSRPATGASSVRLLIRQFRHCIEVAPHPPTQPNIEDRAQAQMQVLEEIPDSQPDRQRWPDRAVETADRPRRSAAAHAPGARQSCCCRHRKSSRPSVIVQTTKRFFRPKRKSKYDAQR